MGQEIKAGNYFSFRFQFRNPYCNHTSVNPCVRANRILTNQCNSTIVPRSNMKKDSVTTIGVNLPALGDVALEKKSGEALPLNIRTPEITAAVIAQSSAWPCDLNTITMTLTTNVPLISDVGHTVTVRGLQGFRAGVRVPMAGPATTGSITVFGAAVDSGHVCLLYTSPSPRDVEESRMPSSA